MFRNFGAHGLSRYGDEFGLGRFQAEVGLIPVGARTYDQCRAMGWDFLGEPCVVLSRARAGASEGRHGFIAGDTADIVARLAERTRLAAGRA